MTFNKFMSQLDELNDAIEAETKAETERAQRAIEGIRQGARELYEEMSQDDDEFTIGQGDVGFKLNPELFSDAEESEIREFQINDEDEFTIGQDDVGFKLNPSLFS